METPRYNIYVFIHKALRAMMLDTLTALGRADFEDDEEVSGALDKTDDLLQFCRGHLQHENDFIHTAIKARAPRLKIRTADDHVEHERHIARLQQEADSLRKFPALRRQLALLNLYRHLALFIADNFEHMQIEETENAQALWECYSDAEIMAIESALVKSLSPEESSKDAAWILPNIGHGDRVMLVSGMRAGTPPEAFNGILQMLKNSLPAAQWSKLCRDLEVDPGVTISLAA